LAAKIPKVLYQQPCYCYCDRALGHKSLHSCYEGQHAAVCSACLKELYYSYVMTKQKKTPEQIRQGIVAGEWQSIDLETAASIDQLTDLPLSTAKEPFGIQIASKVVQVDVRLRLRV